jgi:hypothetical protein
MIGPLAWSKRTIWHGFRRYTIHKLKMDFGQDEAGQACVMEQYAIHRKEAWVLCRIDKGMLRFSPDPEKTRREEWALHIAALEQWRRENPPPSKIREGRDG